MEVEYWEEKNQTGLSPSPLYLYTQTTIKSSYLTCILFFCPCLLLPWLHGTLSSAETLRVVVRGEEEVYSCLFIYIFIYFSVAYYL